MTKAPRKNAVLLLRDGTEFRGKAYGAEGTSLGEVVFTTSAVGFQETVTDPNYFGKIIVQTFPLTGNYGVNGDDSEIGRSYAAGYVARELCDEPSNFRSEGTLESFLREQGVVSIGELDTRALTIHLRENGTMPGAIAPEEGYDREALLERLAHFQPEDGMSRVSVSEPRCWKAKNGRCHVVLVDLGCKRSTLDAFLQKGCSVTALPYTASVHEILAYKPDGILLAGGPERPAGGRSLARRLAPLLQCGLPVMGIGSGHQLLAMAAGGHTMPMPHGHRGGSQPVKDEILGRTFVTSQNHGFAVDESTLDPERCRVFCRNLNDRTCEGILYLDAPAFSIQFEPQAFTGTEDTLYYVGRFVQMMQKEEK